MGSEITREDVALCRAAAASLREVMKQFGAELENRPFFDPIAALSRQWQELDLLAAKLDKMLPCNALWCPCTDADGPGYHSNSPGSVHRQAP